MRRIVLICGLCLLGAGGWIIPSGTAITHEEKLKQRAIAKLFKQKVIAQLDRFKTDEATEDAEFVSKLTDDQINQLMKEGETKMDEGGKLPISYSPRYKDGIPRYKDDTLQLPNYKITLQPVGPDDTASTANGSSQSSRSSSRGSDGSGTTRGSTDPSPSIATCDSDSSNVAIPRFPQRPTHTGEKGTKGRFQKVRLLDAIEGFIQNVVSNLSQRLKLEKVPEKKAALEVAIKFIGLLNDKNREALFQGKLLINNNTQENMQIILEKEREKSKKEEEIKEILSDIRKQSIIFENENMALEGEIKERQNAILKTKNEEQQNKLLEEPTKRREDNNKRLETLHLQSASKKEKQEKQDKLFKELDKIKTDYEESREIFNKNILNDSGSNTSMNSVFNKTHKRTIEFTLVDNPDAVNVELRED